MSIAEKKYMICQFKEGGIAPVPVNWISSDFSSCKYPPLEWTKGNKLYNTMKQFKAFEDTWETYTITQVYGMHSKYASYIVE